LKKVVLVLALVLFGLNRCFIFSQNPDINLLKHINLERNRSLDGTFILITNSAAPVAIGTPLILCGVGLIRHDSLAVRKSLNIGASVAVTVMFTTIAKYAFNRPRPFETYSFIEKESYGGSPSFPSGHTSEAFALATSVSLNYPRWYIIAPSFLWAGAVGYSRMDLGVHYPSDVLAGAVLGAGCAWLTFTINRMLYHKPVTHAKLTSYK
jgi:membrane-associated phospholipid phosphatase